jgi:hypothetical protein
MIASVNFGGLGKPAPNVAPLVAPTPPEHKKPKMQHIKNTYPKQIDE